MTYSEHENELRSAVRSVLEDRAAFGAVLARTETEQTYDTGLWRTLAAEVGCAGLLIPESLGGAGASFREAAVVAEEAGRSVAPVPYLGSAVVATVALLSVLRAGEPGSASAGELLTDLAAGTTTAALGVPFASMPGTRPEPTVRIGPAAGGDADGTYRLSGHGFRPWPTRCPPTCCSSRRTASRTGCSWSAPTSLACGGRPWSRWT